MGFLFAAWSALFAATAGGHGDWTARAVGGLSFASRERRVAGAWWNEPFAVSRAKHSHATPEGDRVSFPRTVALLDGVAYDTTGARVGAQAVVAAYEAGGAAFLCSA